jgi:hypothetical protein
MGYQRLPQFVGAIDSKAPYQPELIETAEEETA